MKLAMIGSGYVGLVSGACFASFGHDVVCVDVDAARIENLKQGIIPIYEPGLDALVAETAAAGRLSFTTDLEAAVAASQVVFIAVGTPSRRGDGHADLSYVHGAAREVARAMNGPTTIVTKSTVPVGTGDEIERIVRELRPDAAFSVASNPEFLREGSAIEDFKRPDRIVVGTVDGDELGRVALSGVYRPLSINAAPVFFTQRRTAELIKYAGNAYLAMRITYINEIADLCERVGADVQDVARGIGLDGRIGPKFLHAGPGYGGSCFPKDTLALVKTAQDAGSPMRLIETTVAINDARKRQMARKVVATCGGDLRGKRVAVLGLTFKPNTDDMREAPSIALVQALQDMGAEIVAYDPAGMEQARSVIEGVAYADDVDAATNGADVLVIVTEWDTFRALDFARLRETMRGRAVVDLRNVYDPQTVEREGFAYTGVGRRSALQPVPDQTLPQDFEGGTPVLQGAAAVPERRG